MKVDDGVNVVLNITNHEKEVRLRVNRAKSNKELVQPKFHNIMLTPKELEIHWDIGNFHYWNLDAWIFYNKDDVIKIVLDKMTAATKLLEKLEKL